MIDFDTRSKAPALDNKRRARISKKDREALRVIFWAAAAEGLRGKLDDMAMTISFTTKRKKGKHGEWHPKDLEEFRSIIDIFDEAQQQLRAATPKRILWRVQKKVARDERNKP